MTSVVAVQRSSAHSFSKQSEDSIELIEGQGVLGDAHRGVTVQHLSRMRTDPDLPNLRQVHLIHAELFDQLAAAGFSVKPGDLGENITTRGVDLLNLPVGTHLAIGDAVITVTGLRSPCRQIDEFQHGLLKQVVHTTDDGSVVRLTGVMGIVSRGGKVEPDDQIEVELPPLPHHPLNKV